MKKLILLASLACFAITATSTEATAQVKTATATKTVAWVKSTTGTWVGKDNVKYKIKSDLTIWSSSNGTTWAATEGLWQDKAGKWYKVNEQKLKGSTDNGRTWTEVPDWAWQGVDGKWNKFDANFALLTR